MVKDNPKTQPKRNTKKTRSAISDVVAREYTIHMHKRVRRGPSHNLVKHVYGRNGEADCAGQAQNLEPHIQKSMEAEEKDTGRGLFFLLIEARTPTIDRPCPALQIF